MPLAPPGTAEVARAERAPLPAFPRHPEPAAYHQLIGGLLDRPVTAIPRSNPERLEVGTDVFRADYVTPDGVVAVSVVVPIALGVGLAAGLALVPAAMADSWVEAGEMPDDAVGNLYEVLNVLSAPFNDVNLDRHIKISSMANPGQPHSDAMAELFRSARKYEVLDISVEDYPGGPLSVYSR